MFWLTLLIGGLVICLLQLLLCFKTSRIYLKLIPLFMLLVGITHCSTVYFGLFQDLSSEGMEVSRIMAGLLGLVLAAAAAGMAIGWAVYGIALLVRRSKHGK